MDDTNTKGPQGRPTRKPMGKTPDPVEQIATAAGPVRKEVETALRTGRTSGGEH